MLLDRGLSAFVSDFRRDGLAVTLGEGRTVGCRYVRGFTGEAAGA